MSCVFSIIIIIILREMFLISLDSFAEIKVIQTERFWWWTSPGSFTEFIDFIFLIVDFSSVQNEFFLYIISFTQIQIAHLKRARTSSKETGKIKMNYSIPRNLEQWFYKHFEIWIRIWLPARYQANDCVWRHLLHNEFIVSNYFVIIFLLFCKNISFGIFILRMFIWRSRKIDGGSIKSWWVGYRCFFFYQK